MSIPRFFVPLPLAAGALGLPERVAHHMRVLRLKAGDAIEVFNHQGQLWRGEVSGNQSSLCAELKAPLTHDTELPFQLSVAQGLVEPSKMDWVIEKAVELGVHTVLPIAAQRSVTKLSPERAAKRLAHWQGIAIAASEQSGRSQLMQVAQPMSMTQALSQPIGLHLLLLPVGGIPLSQFCKQTAPQNLTLWIGPEGGWSPEETNKLEKAGAQRISFGPRVLRTETAAAAISAALQALWAHQ